MSANTSIAPPAAAPTKTAKVSAPRSPRSVLIAGYAVLVPLVAMAMVVVTTYPANGTDAVLRVEITYAAALLSFVGGIRWGIALMAGSAHLQWKPLTFITAALPLGNDNPLPHWYRALFMPFTVMIEIGLGLSLITILSV